MSHKKPEWIDLPLDVIEKHLTTECGLTVLEENTMFYDLEDAYDLPNYDLAIHGPEAALDLPDHSHPTWNSGTTELWQPEQDQWYDQAHFDQVLSVSIDNYPSEEAAQTALLHMCMRLNVRRVGTVFISRNRWCVRARSVEE